MKLKIFRIIALIAGGYHVLLALAGLILPVDTATSITQTTFGVALEQTPQLAMILKFASVYLLAFGLMLILLATNPPKYRIFVLPALVLFGLRFINRLILFNDLNEAGVSFSRNVVGIVLIGLFFLGLLITMPKSTKTT